MADKTYKYVLDFKGKSDQVKGEINGLKGMLKGAAAAAGALFAAAMIKDAAKAVFDYSMEISALKDTVERFTGVQGAALDNMTGQVKALSYAYAQDINESVKAANVMMRTFGSTNQEVFDIMNVGFSSTANANGDFLAQIQNMSVHFREAGLNAAQMVAVMMEGNKLGFGSKASETIMQASVRLREMNQGTKDAINNIGLNADAIEQGIRSGTISMFEAMQLISGQLKQLPPQSSEVGNVLRDVFGRSGKDAVGFIRNLSEVNTELSVIQGNLQDGEKLQMRWAEALAEFHSIGSQVFTGTDDMVTALKATMVEWVNAAIKGTVNLINYFIDLYNESAIFRGAMEGIAFVVKSTFDMMGHSLRQLVNLFTGFGKIWGAILKGEFSKVREIAKESLGEMVEDGKAFGQKLADNFNTAVSNTLGEREKIQAITLSAEAAEAAGKTTGLNYANGFKTGAASVAAAKVATPYVDEGMGPQQFDIAKMQEQNYEAARLAVAKQREAGLIDQKQYNSLMLQAEMEFTENMLKLATLRGEYTTGIELKHAELQIQANEALVVSYQELGSAAAGSLNTIASAVGGAASSWFTFFGVLAEQIPALIASIQSMTGAQVASSGAIIAAKQGEATAGAVAGASKMPFPASLIAMLASVAAVASIFMAIPKFAFGGIVPGGSFGGDNMLIRANSGEEVLRRDDPRHQFNQKASNRGIAGVVVNLVQDGLYIDGDKLRILLRKSDEKLALRTVNYG